ncbi:MAG: SDR family oxidoreductase [Pseudomonadota bacterium]|nr:SDR family oxidoreductase [Pseudomonadota bacterium]
MKGWALVTGASRRIGRIIALDMAAAGWDIIVHYNTSQKEAEKTLIEIQRLGSRACLASVDLTHTGLVRKLFPFLTEELGPIGALVNNAAVFLPDRLDAENNHEKINFDAPRLLSEGFYKQALGSGVILNVLDADPTTPDFGHYNASKKKLAALTLKHAGHFAPRVRVNGIALGATLRGPRESLKHFQTLVKKSPLRKPIDPVSIAATIRFLIDNEAVTGAVVPVDGGLHLKSGKSGEAL